MEQHKCDDTCPVCGLVPLAPSLRRSARIVAQSPAMQTLLKRVARFAASEAPVAVLGETGSGKEVVARTIHQNSPRAQKRFVAVNVAALPPELLESELFGHVKGAFTGAATEKKGLFEEADGGTLFLDEIAEMPLGLQVKLLRAVQDGELRRVGGTQPFSVDVRLVCATHRDLAEHVRKGTFREDLYFRLKVLTLRVPPLRERREDVLPLARNFLVEERRALRGFSTDAEDRLLAYAWPGNVRELQNAVKHGAALAQGEEVTADDLPDELSATAVAGGVRKVDLRPLEEVEREHILKVIEACDGSMVDAARILGVARNTLWRKVRGYAS